LTGRKEGRKDTKKSGEIISEECKEMATHILIKVVKLRMVQTIMKLTQMNSPDQCNDGDN